jgi:N-methylhydantoinase B
MLAVGAGQRAGGSRLPVSTGVSLDPASLDPITVEEIGNHLLAIAEEMEVILVKSSYSTNIKERRDCSTAIIDAGGEVVAQGQHNPMHLGAVAGIVREILGSFAVEDIEPGDVYVANDPYFGGNTHLPDLAVAMPFFDGGRLLGFVTNAAHHAEIGGSPSAATDIYCEGLRIPAVRFYRAGRLEADVLELFLINCRVPRERQGDLRAQIAACQGGVKRLDELFGRYGAETVLAAREQLFQQAERQLRRAVERVPDGRYEFADVIDDDGVDKGPFTIRVAVTVDGDRLRFDFGGTDPQVRGGVNMVFEATRAVVQYAVKSVLDPTLPPNSGFTRAIEIVAPEGTIANSQPPGATMNRSDTAQRFVDVIFGALAQALPERVIAASNGAISGCQFFGLGRGNEGYYSYLETIGGGMGARPTKDGPDGVQTHMSNTSNLPVEALELEYPLRVERYELIADSGGAGRYRGGLGLRREYRVLADENRLRTKGERHHSAPWGLFGGGPGRSGANRLNPGPSEEPIGSKAYNLPLGHGDLVRIDTPGAGGYGPPAERERQAVVWDLLEAKVSSEVARAVYGVEAEADELAALSTGHRPPVGEVGAPRPHAGGAR